MRSHGGPLWDASLKIQKGMRSRALVRKTLKVTHSGKRGAGTIESWTWDLPLAPNERITSDAGFALTAVRAE